MSAHAVSLRGNILKYNLYKVFTKRVHLPLITIFLVTIAGLDLKQIAIIASIAAVVQLILEVPTGYIADVIGHKNSLLIGGFLCMVSVLFYIFEPNFFGGAMGSAIFFAGGAFSSGSLQSFMHNTLIDLKERDEYSKIMGRAQSFGLVGNMVLVALVPLTYSIHPLMPFWIGFLCLTIAFIITLTFKNSRSEFQHKKTHISVGKFFSSFSKRHLWILGSVFLIFALVSSAFDHSGMYREIIYANLGIEPKYFGFLIALGSCLAAIFGRYIHHLKSLSPKQFYLFDILYIVFSFILVGLTRNPIIIVAAFVLFPAYDRTRNIIYESQIFDEFHNSRYKSTLISIMNFVTLVNSLWLPLLFSAVVIRSNLYLGYIHFGLIIGGICIMVLLAHNYLTNKKFGR